MRHSSITLTMDTCGHLFPGQEADAVARLPDLLAAPPALQATGTDDVTAEGLHAAQHRAQQSGRDTRRNGATEDDQETQQASDPDSGTTRPNVLSLTSLGKGVRANATGGEKRRARESNPQPHTGQLISNQPPHQFGYPPDVAAKHFFLLLYDNFVSL